MNISVHEANNQYYNGASGAGWALGWSSQKLVSASQVTATGGTYEIVAPVHEEKEIVAPETPKRGPGRPKKTK